MARKNSENDWIDPRGKAIPPKYIKPIDRKRDQAVEVIVNRMIKLSKNMAKVKSDALIRLEVFIQQAEKDAGVPITGKGNIQLTNFSGDRQVEFSINDIIEFDEKLQMAKTVIDECFERWSEGAHDNLKAIVDQAFSVHKKGKINTVEILKLRSVNIKDKDWKKAMDLISDSIKVVGTRRYLNARERDEKGIWKNIKLNFSSM